MMLVRVIEARYLGGHRVEVAFNDGRKGVADLSEAMEGPAFEELKNKSAFSRFYVDKELDTIVWENGADLAPEYIFFQAFKNEFELQPQFIKWGYITRDN
jgi:hypothetical protein